MASAARITRSEIIPPLENGDHLTAAEFHRRYETMPENFRAELIQGVVYVSSPVGRRHGRPHVRLGTWLCTYEVHTPGCETVDNTTVRLQVGESEPQPDVSLYVLPENGGQVQFDDDYIVGGPDLTAEVSSSSASIDLHGKLLAYQENQVREYIVWRVRDRELDWFSLRGTRYTRLKPGADDIYRSKVFPGLWLDWQALIDGNMTRVLEVLQHGLDSPDHQRFVQKLQARKE